MKTCIARVGALAGLVVAGSLVAAQEKPVEPVPPGRGLLFMMDGPFGPEGAGRVVKGQPYSAQTVTEMTQTLADGNRIVQRTEGAVCRDGEGRTRREQTLTGMGPVPFDRAMRGRQIITIDDVVAGVQYALDPQDKTARQLPRWSSEPRPDEGPPRPGAPRTRLRAPDGDPADAPAPARESFATKVIEGFEADGVHTAVAIAAGDIADAPAPVRESLGTKVIEGFEADGVRTTVTIPAGDIGNEAPIAIVTERWISKDLKVPVLTRFSDPRMGERVYRLTSITRGEPSPQLFAVPPDYKTVAGPGPMRRKHMP